MNQRYQTQRWTGLLFFLAIAVPVSIASADNDINLKHRMALNFNEAMNRCLESGCKNIEEIMGFFDKEAVFIDEEGDSFHRPAEIRKRLTKTAEIPGLSDQIETIDVNGSIISMRLQRRLQQGSNNPKPGWGPIVRVKPHVDVIVLKGGRISRLICVLPPDEK